MREQRQRSGLVADVVEQDVDQTGLEQQGGFPGGSFDGLAQVVLAQRSQNHQATLGEAAEPGERRQVAEAVGPDSKDNGSALGLGHQGTGQLVAQVEIGALREQLLELVDDEDRTALTGQLLDQLSGRLPRGPAAGPWFRPAPATRSRPP